MENTQQLDGIQKTLLMPLWGRAKLSKEDNPVLIDTKAIEIIEKLDYDFRDIDKCVPYLGHMVTLLRAKAFDNAILNFLEKHPQSVVVNFGAGLDTAFYRVDNQQIDWYDIDLPDVIELRHQLIPETDRSHYIRGSIFDMEWIQNIPPNKPVIFMSIGVLEYFDKGLILKFLGDLASIFPESEILFNTTSSNIISTYFTKRAMKKMRMEASPITLGNFIEELKRTDGRIEIIEDSSIISKFTVEDVQNKKLFRNLKMYDFFTPTHIVHLKFLV